MNVRDSWQFRQNFHVGLKNNVMVLKLSISMPEEGLLKNPITPSSFSTFSTQHEN